MAPLQFTPLTSSISPSFWQALTQLKLHKFKLSDEPIPITGNYRKGRSVLDRTTGETVELPGGVELDAAAFEDATSSSSSLSDRVPLKGILYNYNTIESFKNVDKIALLSSAADELWRYTTTTREGNATGDNQLNPFIIITFADLKKYRYYYWCAFPALLQKPGWETDLDEGVEWSEIEKSGFSEAEIDQIKQYQSSTFFTASPFALARPSPSSAITEPLEFSPLPTASKFFSCVSSTSRTLIFHDPSSHPSAPGWPLRNALTYLSQSGEGTTELRLVVCREKEVRCVRIHRKGIVEQQVEEGRPGVVGWEKNDQGKLGPRMADLGPLLDPVKLADQAVDLNLQLMRWRIMPSLDLEKIKHTKVLLLGAGTLGCYVARTLMAWGVRKITLVDSSTVSFSNPVRQPLFEFEDSLHGGKPKAEAAAASLKRIYPGVDAEGHKLSIPMPGHPIPGHLLEEAKADVKRLEELIKEHDVVYLLMDSRESRWLPTVIGASLGKLVMNVALGFDTFLVMRHGLPPLPPAEGESSTKKEDTVVPGQAYTGRLGCYYCNDIVAPMDSLTDRTLDQMCTVTRPGIASIASSTAVELMVSILQHPAGPHAPSDIGTPSSAEQAGETLSPLGIVPHQIRGYLAQFHNMKITGQAYDRCTGCSDRVVKAYEKDGFEMLQKAFQDAKYLEELTGLDKLMEESEKLMEGFEDWDEEDVEEG